MRKLTKKGLHKKAWNIFSKYIRLREADWGGEVACYTCKTKHHWKELQAGHFKHNKLDFNELNIHPQCIKCNHFKNGNLDMYATYLVQDYGKGILDKLNKLASKDSIKYYTEQDYKKIYEEYNKKLVGLIKNN